MAMKQKNLVNEEMVVIAVRKILILFHLFLNDHREQAVTVKGFQNKSNVKFHCQLLALEN